MIEINVKNRADKWIARHFSVFPVFMWTSNGELSVEGKRVRFFGFGIMKRQRS
jgi:hypothetical protein